MAVVHKRGLFFKPKNKKALVLSAVLLLISLFALFVVNNLNNRTVSVNEHADTKLSPTIAEYSSETACQGQTFVIKYKIVLKTPIMDDTSKTVTYALQAFFPGVTQQTWVTYISGQGKVLGHSSIKWSGQMHANETKEIYYTLTIPGGKLKPGANYKNIVVLVSSSGYKEQKDNSVVIDSCGVIATNPILPTPTVTPSSTSVLTNNSSDLSNNADSSANTVTSNSASNDSNNSGIEDAGLLGRLVTSDNTDDSSNSTLDSNDSNNQSTTYTDAESNNITTGGANDANNTANPPQGAQLEAANINTGVLDSPITAIVLFIFGIIGRLLGIFKGKSKHAVVYYETVE